MSRAAAIAWRSFWLPITASLVWIRKTCLTALGSAATESFGFFFSSAASLGRISAMSSAPETRPAFTVAGSLTIRNLTSLSSGRLEPT